MTFTSLIRAALTAAVFSGTAASSALAEGKRFDPEQDTLVISLAAALASIDPIKANSARTEGNVLTNVYSVLARVGADGKLHPDAAEKWEQTAPNEWLFTLRPDIHFTNGDPLDAAAVVAAFERALDRSQSTIAARIASFESAEAISPREVLFRTKSQDFQFPFRTTDIYLTDANWLTTNNPAINALGSGAYKLISYDPQGVIRLERNEDYYGEKPAFRHAEFRVITTEANRIAALQAGEVHVATGLDPISLEQFEGNADLNVGAVPGFRTHFILFDTAQPPLDNVKVRQALNYAVNKAEIAETVLKGLIQPSTQFLSRTMPGYDPALTGYPYDPEKARALLAEAGFPNGFATEILNAPGSYAGDDLIIQAIAEQLAQVGVQANIKNLPYTTYLEHVFPASLENRKKPSPLNFRSFGYNFPTQNTSFIQLFASDYRGNMYVNPAYDALRDEAFAGATEAAQEESFRKLNHIINDEAPLLLLFDEPLTYAYDKGLNWTPRQENWLRINEFTPVAQ